MACTWCLAVSTFSVCSSGIIKTLMLAANIRGFFSLFLPTIGHDCSIRLWNLESKTCIQEFTAHRKKYDESIHDVAFHPSKCYIASGGADALAKVFVWRNTSLPSSCRLYIKLYKRQGQQSCPLIQVNVSNGPGLLGFFGKVLFSKLKGSYMSSAGKLFQTVRSRTIF